MPMIGTSKLLVYGDYQVLLQGTSDLKAESPSRVIMTGSSAMYASSKGMSGGNSLIPAIGGIGGDFEYSVGNAMIPSIFQHSGQGGFWVPTQTTIGFGMLPSIGGSGILTTIKPGGGDALIPAITGLGGDFHYGVGDAMIPAITSFAMYGLPNDKVEMIDYMLFGGSITTKLALTVVFISEGTITDTVGLTTIQAVEFISNLEASDQMTVLGTFTASFISSLIASSRGSEVLKTAGDIPKPSLDIEGMVWVVNVETGASSQYEDFGFNSFVNRGGEGLGFADNGIYRLSGDDDAGLDIDALVDFGRSDFGTSFKKKCPYVYLGVGSDEKVYLKVDCDEQVYVYEARSNSAAVKNHRVDPGKGLEGNHWNFTLMNKNGSKFILNTIQFEPLISSRRI